MFKIHIISEQLILHILGLIIAVHAQTYLKLAITGSSIIQLVSAACVAIQLANDHSK